MNGNGQTNHDVQWLKKRNSLLCSAILRISASLDLGTVLQEVVDSARALTGARYGVIATIDETGEVRGLRHLRVHSPRSRRQFADWADGPRLFAHLRDLPGPLRLADLPDYVP